MSIKVLTLSLFHGYLGANREGFCEEENERELKFEANKPTGENGKGERWEVC